MDLGKQVFDIALNYLAWWSNQVKDLVLPPIDDMVQLACLLSKRVPTATEILRSKIKVKRKETNLKILRLQKDLGQCHYDTKILKNEIRKKDQKYDLLLEDFKNLGIENEKLKGWTKSKQSLKENQDRGGQKESKTFKNKWKLWKGKSIKPRRKHLRLRVNGKRSMLLIPRSTKEKVHKWKSSYEQKRLSKQR